MKRVLAIVLGLILVMTTFAGCGGGQAGSDVDKSKGVRAFEGVTINMIAEQQTPTVALSKQLGEFEELTGIKVNLEMAPFDNVVQKITLAMQSGSEDYDVIAVPYQFLGNLAVNKFIQPLEPLMNNPDLSIIQEYDSNDIIQGMWDASGKWEDTVYGVPANSCIMFFAYRQDLFENADEQAAFKAKYGYDLTVPEDWNTYKDVAEFFTRKSGETLAGETLTQNFYGVSMSGKRHDATTCEWLNYAWSFGGSIFDEDGNIAINSEKNVAALEYYNDLKKYAPPGVTEKTWDEQTTEMQQGIAAMAVIFNDCAPALENPEESKVIGKMEYGAIPIGGKPAAHYGAWSYFIPTKAANPEAAWVFLQWFNTPEVQKNIALDGGFPNLYSVYNDPELNKLPYWEASMAAYEISTARPRIPEWNEMNEALMLEISKVMSNQSTPKEALNSCAAEYQKILDGKLPVLYQ
ncbi:MAG: sugar ABC transporter substrate-binding protein [Eubacteriales bacterium]|nr:sugar ABC transporter substrate-binding protein [Eubacteriales bacterium]